MHGATVKIILIQVYGSAVYKFSLRELDVFFVIACFR
jgi:hypothetical protein